MKIVKVEANVCPQCKALDFILMATPDVQVEKLNIDNPIPEHLKKKFGTTQDFTDTYGIMGTPTLLFLDDDYDIELGRLVGAKGITPEDIRLAKITAEGRL